MNKYPRVLVINNEPFHSGSATGLTMLSLFRYWPSDKLAQVYTLDIQPDIDISIQSYNFHLRDLRVPGFVNRAIERRLSTAFLQADVDSQNNSFAENATAPLSISNTITKNIRHLLLLFLYLAPYELNSKFSAWLNEYKPEIIYSMLPELNVMRLVLQISDLLEIPIVTHFMDDWPATLHRNDFGRMLLLPYSTFLLKSILKRSPRSLTISESMATEYKKRYGKKFDPFMLCVEPDEIYKPDQEYSCGPVKFVFIGGLHLDRWKSLREIGIAMMALHKEGVEIECSIYTQKINVERYKEKLNIPPVMRIVGSLNHEEVTHIQRKADCLIHIESFGNWDKMYTRHSISSKIPEYLAAGRPILSYGPEGIASIEYLQALSCGEVVTTQHIDCLKTAITKIAVSRELRETMGINAIVACKKNHNSTDQRERFKQVFLDVSNN